LGRVPDMADEPEPVTGADHLGAERGQPLMSDSAYLEVTDVIGCVVHELDVPDAALMRFLKPLKLHLEEIEPLHVAHNRRLPRPMGRLQIRRGESAAQTMIGNHLVDPGKAL